MLPHLLCCQGFAVAYYGFTLDALELGHPQLSLNEGLEAGEDATSFQ